MFGVRWYPEHLRSFRGWKRWLICGSNLCFLRLFGESWFEPRLTVVETMFSLHYEQQSFTQRIMLNWLSKNDKYNLWRLGVITNSTQFWVNCVNTWWIHCVRIVKSISLCLSLLQSRHSTLTLATAECSTTAAHFFVDGNFTNKQLFIPSDDPCCRFSSFLCCTISWQWHMAPHESSSCLDPYSSHEFVSVPINDIDRLCLLAICWRVSSKASPILVWRNMCNPWDRGISVSLAIHDTSRLQIADYAVRCLAKHVIFSLLSLSSYPWASRIFEGVSAVSARLWWELFCCL